MRATTLPLVILVGICGGIFGTDWMLSQDVPENIVKDVRAIEPVVFTVTNEYGIPVTDLTQYDFEVFDNGESRRIQTFTRVRTPYSAVVLLDCSESTRPRANMLVSTVARFADHLRTGDKVLVAAFGTEVRTVIDWNAERKPFNIPDSPMCQGTNFYETLDWAVKKMKGMTGRRGVVVFTDGRDSDVARKEVKVNGLKLRRVVSPEEDGEFQKVLKTVRASGGTFYFVAVDTDKNPGPEYGGPVEDLKQIRIRMEILARDTGGRIITPNEPGDAADFFRQIREDLGVAYSLDFIPSTSKSSTPRKIEIRVRGEDKFHVKQSRDTYIVN